MFRMSLMSLILVTVFFITGCSGQSASGNEKNYDETKKMVVDILQTDDGKKALKNMLSDESMKQQLVMDSDMMKKSVEKTLSSDKATDMWKKLFEDPAFVKTYANSMAKEHKKLMKDLMKDSEFQKQMLDVMKDPQMTSHMVSVLKSQEFNKHLEKTINNTMETPKLQKKMNKIILKAAEEQSSKKKKQSKGGGSGSG
ncbi:spore germination protein GerD [Barrientosiimonas marina]|uniref:Spore germination lipoprotein GerD n=1 Tax=Lentibacillus kimchii TaxID=1542911 RepID=A0ABW2UVU4_9BACI